MGGDDLHRRLRFHRLRTYLRTAADLPQGLARAIAKAAGWLKQE